MTATVEETIRIEGGQVLATLIRLTGDFDLAEDALQDATIEALERWNREGVPARPGAWLTTVARNKALDRLRRESARNRKESEASLLLSAPPPPTASHDPLRLIFTCCHPALSPEARIALTLRTLAGLSTREIARAFFVPDATMGQRIS
ncbi:MAG: sigma-70 family RNA polymerase sigma factor, partial [Actinomycetota bacterium]